MKASELMIDDLVLLDGIPKRLTAWDLVEISRGNYEAEPIPLTEEILNANGFEETNIGFMTKIFGRPSYVMKLNESGYYGIEVIGGYCNIKAKNEEQKEFPLEVNIQCNFVHEMQHALRLCGLNDLADNFKLN